MNAFKYSSNEEKPKQDLRVPIVILASVSNEGAKEGPKNRTAQVASVLAAHKINLDKYSNIKIKH